MQFILQSEMKIKFKISESGNDKRLLIVKQINALLSLCSLNTLKILGLTRQGEHREM